MNIHRFRIPESLAEMRDRAKDVGHLPETGHSDLELFVDQFHNGEYHEDRISWEALASELTDEQITSLVLGVIQHLISSDGLSAEDEASAQLLDFYKYFCLWAQKRMADVHVILDPSKRIRELLSNSVSREGLGWRLDAIRAFSLVEFAIHKRMSLATHDLDRDYDALQEKVIKASLG